MTRVVLLLLVCGASACTHYQPIVNSDATDRIWLVSRSGRDVVRCYDMTPPGAPYKNGLHVFCKEADQYGPMTNPPDDATRGGGKSKMTMSGPEQEMRR